MDVATLRMVTPPGRREEIVAALRWLAGPIRAHRGCTGCRILQDLDDANALVLVEEWSSRQAFERHLRSDDYRRLLALADLAAEPPEIHFDRVAERRGLGLVAEVRDGADLRADSPIRGIEPDGEDVRNAPSDGLEHDWARRAPTTQPGAQSAYNGSEGEPDMRNRLLTTTLVLALLLALASLPAFAGTKVDVCHIPPGDPYNFHTISVSENAVAAHLGHGDYDVACHDVACTSLCDDFDACTQDVESDLEQCICNPEPRPAVDCDDTNPCTVDGCSSEFGCTYDPDPVNGDFCNDDGVCTDGVCVPAIACPCDVPEVWGRLSGTPLTCYDLQSNGVTQLWYDQLENNGLYVHDFSSAGYGIKCCSMVDSDRVCLDIIADDVSVCRAALLQIAADAGLGC